MAVIVKRKRLRTDESDLHRVADRKVGSMARAIVTAMDGLRDRFTVDEWVQAISTGTWSVLLERMDQVSFRKAVDPIELEPLTEEILALQVDGGKASVTWQGLSVAQRADMLTSFTVVNPEAVRWAQQYVATLVQGIVDQNKLAIRGIISNALAHGGHPYDTARLIQHTIGLHPRQVQAIGNFRAGLVAAGTDPARVERMVARRAQQALRERAVTIARTETMSAANRGQQVLWEQMMARGYLAPGTRKVFIASDDERTCPRCMAFDEQTVEVIGGAFSSELGATVDQPPVHPRCRCTTGLVEGTDVRPAQPERQRPSVQFDDDEERGNYPIPSSITEAGEALRARISEEDIANVASYTGTSFRPINAALRSGDLDRLDDFQREVMDSLDRTIALAGDLPEPLTVWRGVNIEAPGFRMSEDEVREAMADYAEAHFKRGKTVSLGGYQSTGMRVEPALDASLSHESPGIIFEIEAHRGAPLNAITRFDDEAEVLLSRDTEYEVLDVLREVGFYREESDVTVTRTVVKLRQL